MVNFKHGTDYYELGDFPLLNKKYPAEIPAPSELKSIPATAKIAMIYSKSNNKWNNHLHELIVVGGQVCRCIGIYQAQNNRGAAVLIVS